MLTKDQTHKVIQVMASHRPTILMAETMEHFKSVASLMRPEDITSYFKDYRPLDKGNAKLDKSILSFSLLPVVTCGRKCKGCYDTKSLRHKSCREKRIVNTLLALRHPGYLFNLIERQVKNSRTCKALRIHVGGDFFSRDYAKQWAWFATSNAAKKIRVYTYTKTDCSDILASAGINVVRSRLDDGSYNFGPLDYIQERARACNGFLCPDTIPGNNKPNGYCGSGCIACQTRKDVFFVLH